MIKRNCKHELQNMVFYYKNTDFDINSVLFHIFKFCRDTTVFFFYFSDQL